MRPGKITALLVEDDLDYSALVQRAFEKAELPATLHRVLDVEGATAYLSGLPPYVDRIQFPLPSFVLLDIKLNGKSGHTLIQWMRQQPALKRLPVVLLTLSPHRDDIARAYELGATSYLIKPEGFEELCAMVKAAALYWGHFNTPGPNGSASL